MVGLVVFALSKDGPKVSLLEAWVAGFLHQKQTTKARNQLKRINKMTHTTSEHDEFERAWLMLADIHIQGGKYDLAQDICKRCIKYNRSCSLAYEFLGNILELEQAYEASSFALLHLPLRAGNKEVGAFVHVRRTPLRTTKPHGSTRGRSLPP